MTQCHMGYMTWQQIADAAARDVPVLIPMGTLEMQGLHKPMGHDYIVAERLAIAVAEHEECLVCPTVNFGYSHFSKPFPGTISLRAETLRNLIMDITESLLRHGFRHLIFINNHTLNEPILGHVADDIRERYGISLASIWPIKMAKDLSHDLYMVEEGVFAHGGEPGISLMMYLNPGDVVREGTQPRELVSPMSDFELAGPGVIKLEGTTINVYMDLQKVFPTGGIGDVGQASEEKGRIIFERMVDLVARFVARFKKVEMQNI